MWFLSLTPGRLLRAGGPGFRMSWSDISHATLDVGMVPVVGEVADVGRL